MEYELREERGSLVVVLEGDIDLEHSPAARQVLLGAVDRMQPVVVDLGSVSYIDSSGVASLVEAFQHARKAGCPFALAAVSASARRVLQLGRLDQIFTIHETLADGLGG